MTIMAWGDLATGDAVSNLTAPPVRRPVRHARGADRPPRGQPHRLAAARPRARAWPSCRSPPPMPCWASRIPALCRRPSWRACWLSAASSRSPLGLGFMLLLFPSGSLPSPRWRPLAAGLLATALTLAGFVVRPRLLALPAPGGDTSVTDPKPARHQVAGRCPLNGPIGTLNGLAVLGTVPGGGLRLPGRSATGRAGAKCGSRSSGSRWWWPRWPPASSSRCWRSPPTRDARHP